MFTRISASQDSSAPVEELFSKAGKNQSEIEMSELPLSVFALAGGPISEVNFGPKSMEGYDIEVEKSSHMKSRNSSNISLAFFMVLRSAMRFV